MTTTSRPDLHFARRELLDLQRDRDGAAARARAAEDHAAAMHRIASELERVVDPLRTALEPIAALHTTVTWEGRAADASRTRLAARDEQRSAALGPIADLVTELQAAAARCEQIAEVRWGDHAIFAGQVRGLEQLLGHRPGFGQIR